MAKALVADPDRREKVVVISVPQVPYRIRAIVRREPGKVDLEEGLAVQEDETSKGDVRLITRGPARIKFSTASTATTMVN